jgi:hypothetical protein
MEKLDQKQKVEEVVSPEIDLNVAKKGELNESFLMMLGGAIQILLRSMFGTGPSFTGSIKGTPQQIEAFSKTLAGEKRYMDSFHKFGLSDPRTYKSKNMLDKAIQGFEKVTKIKWPFGK